MLTLLFCSMAAQSLASSEIIVRKADSDDVLQFATGLYLMVNNQFALESQGNGTVFLTTAKQGEGEDAFEEKINFTATQQDEDVLLEIHDAKLRRDASGKMKFEQISRPGPERFYLALVRSMFNDHYTFGYTLATDYKDGGFVIDDVIKDSAMAKAGIRDGDILVAVNKVAIKAEDEALYNDVALPATFTGKATEFEISRQGEHLTFVVKPTPAKAALKNRHQDE